MRNARLTLPTLLSVAALALPASAAAAEQGEVKMMAPWESSGQLFRVGPQEVLFIGVGEGIVYIEDGEGALDSALLVCPGTREMSVETGKTRGHGRCVLTGAGGDQVFAMYQCDGAEGECKGKFELTGGTGKFAGITGSGELFVRTALAAIARDAETGTTVSGAAGLAVWPKLTYKIP